MWKKSRNESVELRSYSTTKSAARIVKLNGDAICDENKKSWIEELEQKVKKLLKEAVEGGVITCPKCENLLEPDAEKCQCGWENPLRKYGYI